MFAIIGHRRAALAALLLAAAAPPPAAAQSAATLCGPTADTARAKTVHDSTVRTPPDSGRFTATRLVIATCVTATAAPTPTPPPDTTTPAPTPTPTPTPGTNEPAGMTRITESTFASLTEDGWRPYYAVSLAADASDPKSPSGVAVIRYPAGFAGGDSPGLIERGFGATAWRTLYVAVWAKWSSNWQGHPTGTNKFAHFWIGGANRMLFNMGVVGTGAMQPEVGLQGVAGLPAAGAWLGCNLAPVTVPRGAWLKWEVIAKGNTDGQRDGSVELFANGTRCGYHTGIQWVASGATWTLAKLDPTWGGLGGTVSSAMTLQYGHVRISGK